MIDFQKAEQMDFDLAKALAQAKAQHDLASAKAIEGILRYRRRATIERIEFLVIVERPMWLPPVDRRDVTIVLNEMVENSQDRDLEGWGILDVRPKGV